MAKKVVLLFVFNGLADWEPALALAEVQQNAAYEVRTVATGAAPVRTAGGLALLPDQTLAQTSLADCALLLLPGGSAWETGSLSEVYPVIAQAVQAQVPVAAICGATIALAQTGALAHRAHTSNGANYLAQHAPGYAGQAHYQAQFCVADQQVITANGTGYVEFAREILRILQVYDGPTLAQWYTFFKNGHMGE
ncbi:MAG: DJ-1/PfpI family protein [Bernardetiaceae bacterium]|jgi:putative intracellular protease/amidase|nr:DJ-1/PfpI family protein [Bernardetiaceae bacterium]